MRSLRLKNELLTQREIETAVSEKQLSFEIHAAFSEFVGRENVYRILEDEFKDRKLLSEDDLK